MSELDPSKNESSPCIECPSREKVSQALVELGLKMCEGPITVSTATLEELDENTTRVPLFVNGGRYDLGEWKQEIVCGKENLNPGIDEVPYEPEAEDIVWVGEDGKRYAAFVKGTPEGLEAYTGIKAVTAHLLEED
jgi:hypothetical protein